MEIKREDIIVIIDYVRKQLKKSNIFNSLVIDVECESDDLIHGISNEYLSDFYETLTGNKVCVVGDVEELFECPCCGFKTLSEKFDIEEGTGYDICPLCGWEDDGTVEVDKYTSINKGSISDYRKKLSGKNISNKWLKGHEHRYT